MNDIKPSIDESSECDAADLNAVVAAMTPEERAEYLAWCDYINAVVAAMTPEERAEYLAWCDEMRAANLAYQMEHDAPDEGEPASDEGSK